MSVALVLHYSIKLLFNYHFNCSKTCQIQRHPSKPHIILQIRVKTLLVFPAVVIFKWDIRCSIMYYANFSCLLNV